MPGGADILGPLLQFFGQTPEEQSQNLKALLGEIQGMSASAKGQEQSAKATNGYTPMMTMMMQRMARAQMGAPPINAGMRMPQISPEIIQSLLRGVR